MTLNQTHSNDTPVFNGGYQVLASIAKSMGYHVSAQQLTHQMGQGRRSPTTHDLMRAAKFIGVRVRLVSNPTEQKLRALPVPAMIKLSDGSWQIFKGRISGDLFRLVDPMERGRPNVDLKMAELYGRFGGEVMLIGKSFGHVAEDVGFSLSWFMPLIKRHKRPLIEMLTISFFVNLMALGYPLSFQIVIDKVLQHKSFSTLIIVIVALLLLAVFSGILSYMRQYLLQHTANRIDVELGAKLYSHMLHLPISYFETRAAGVIVTRVRELRAIRAFLTGQALLNVVDLLFIVIYFAVLFVYSPILTCVVLAAVPLYVAIGFFIRPMLRRLLKAKFRAFARGQQLMLESIVGIQTVKALAVEPLFERRWEERLAAYAHTTFEATLLGVKASTITTFVSKLTSATILFFGVLNVISGSMTVGGLIAFNMISRLISKPIMRTSQLYQSFQEVQVSIEHVADIFDAEVERIDQATLPRPNLSGEVSFRNVVFRYRPDLPPVLKNISLEIEPGEVIGIVGPSGAGKSTLTKLLQRFHTPSSGEILVDGIDISQADPAWLRRQLGVVLQDNFLFNQTVHENIAIARPEMPRAQVIRVAGLAGADEFISELPQGYDTLLEERGANLSGGQRQRLAIARALATNPRILIFDEATSALDYESERIIQDNMNRIVQDRTVIIISHRLAAVRHCDLIVGMAKGEISEVGTHEQLLRRRGGLYAHLWSLQNENVSS
jgi:ATP-binding cassette, subfamily B, bacterial HlyB/CyaB